MLEMEVVINGDAKEIAALVAELQKRQTAEDLIERVKKIESIIRNGKGENYEKYER